ncbi:3-mercaptopyruvate sulfurtransferase [Aquabacterium sp. NJ1]|uniref:sulfurtransferase n=1 Tax=Aquabacterium sp. NJ1 TaxID=1538295 RepID=UPI00052DD89F|nr:sulfurtransferase [Aquabacterium sp. NJ1]KGM40670.1 3-mercaptopyruvate sulfurtransferase [Aquabacterium sp. NJ1]
MPTSPLISADELRQALSRADQDWLLIDCRFNLGNTAAGEAAYAQGHLPGALYAHLDRDLSGPKTGTNGRHPMPSPETFECTVQSWGIQPGTRVVAYDDAGGMFAARLWWLLRWAGFEQVQVLDGGWQAWLAAQGPVDTHAATRRSPSAFQIQPRADWVVRAADVQARLGQPEQQLLIDARAADRFRGENETMDPVGGHIPGARNRFFQLNLQADGRFKPADQLKAEFEALLAASPMNTVVHQCGSGVTACHNLLAMAQAGLPATRLYAGSWSEWCADPARPVER